jgi:excisionase family DNA binding protein
MSATRKYLRAVEIVALTGMSLRTVRRWCADEVLPSVKVGGARLVAAADLEAVLSGSRGRPSQSPEEGEESDAES